MKIENLKPGQVLYSCRRARMGNTTMKTLYVHKVQIGEIAEDKKSFMASWNGNHAEKHYRVPPEWKAKKPVVVENRLTNRLATREEIKTGTLVERPFYFILKPKPSN